MELFGGVERAFGAAIYPNRVLVAAIVAVGVPLLIVVARRRHWGEVARRHPRTAGVAVALAAAVLMPSAWYLGSPLFLSSAVDEAPPVIAATTPTPASTSGNDAPTSWSGTPTTPPTPVPPLLSRSGTFRGADDFHFGRGTVRLIETAAGVFTVRLEALQVRNGPDLYVYLSPSADGLAKGAIELGRLKADRGNQNYPVPANADVSDVRSVVIWCKQFAVLFATARLGD